MKKLKFTMYQIVSAIKKQKEGIPECVFCYFYNFKSLTYNRYLCIQ